MVDSDHQSEDSGENDAAANPASPDDRDPVDQIFAIEPMSASRLRGLGIAATVAILAIQIALLVIVIGTRSDVSDLRAEVEDLDTSFGLSDLGSGLSSAGPTSAPSETTGSTVETGDLPRFLGGGADAALGRNIGDITALEYYRDEDIVLAAADGKARAYMVWAHWCPYCQQELPIMSDWHATNATGLEGFELVSVTTAMDPTASNPLVPYLDSSRFPFPVLVDQDGSLAAKFGVNAFPFWVFVAPEGTVVGRAAGYIEPDNLNDVFEQLNQMALDGPAALSGAGG